MPGRTDVREIDQQGTVTSPKRRFDARDWDYIAEYVNDEYETRKRDRSDREKQWKDIDRQIAMEPNTAFKKLPNGELDPGKVWMAEMELPLQAQALEVLTADARRLMFPDSGQWFRAHAEMTDKYLQRVDFTSMILGDEAEVPSIINQDNADKLVQGFLMAQFRQYDLMSRVDRINAESFKYGMGLARARMETKNVYIHEARGTRVETQRIPVLVPVSIKNHYLDAPMPSIHSAQVLGPAHIAEDYIKLENLILAANKGSNDPEDPDGGWMPVNVKKLEADDKGYVKVLEMEGDIVIPRKTTRSMVLPGAIVTVATGGKTAGGNVSRGVVRFRFRPTNTMSSYLLFPYHYEGADDTYPTSPLMKGRPVQIAAVDALNRLMDSAALKSQPPVAYDRNDMTFAQKGGPAIFPSAQWGTTDPLKVYAEVGGDPSAMAAILAQHINLFAELTGVLPARLGAQTVSHTTAFAKNAELQRGATRTVDYVNTVGQGALTRWLYMAYEMGRDALRKSDKISFFIDSYGGFVEIGKDALPDAASFEWFGAGGPQEENDKMANRLNALLMAFKLDQVKMATGQQPTIDLDAAIKQILREGGWTDLDQITHMASPAPALGPGPVVAAIQNLGAQQTS